MLPDARPVGTRQVVRRGVESLLAGERVVVPMDDGTAELCITVSRDELEALFSRGLVRSFDDPSRCAAFAEACGLQRSRQPGRRGPVRLLR